MATVGTKISKIFQARIVRNIFRLRRYGRKSINSFPLLPNILYPSKLILLSQCGILFKNNDKEMQNFDLNLQQACELGDTAIIEIIEVLKDQIVAVCKAYQECLKTQMEIIREATEAGPLSPRWDDLPEYRSLASELNEELNNFTVILNTVGQMAHDESMKYITQNKEQLKLISKKFNEAQQIIQVQIDQIKKSEATLLELKRKVILKTR